MCIAPSRLSDGTDVACHECWQCREQRINDWVGRCIAESKTAKACHAVTLTYGRSRLGDVDHERAVILTYSDVQKYLKLLRRHGYPVRYFVTGELGSLKGRAHWHIILFWQDGFPPVELDKRFMEDHWPHGWSHWTLGTSAKNIRYNCKYVQKNLGDAERQGHLAMSKKPPLGAAYFAQMAERYVKSELAPQDLVYTFPEVRRGKPGAQSLVQFHLRDRSAELFLEHYVNTWSRAYPGREMPRSDLVENWVQWGVTRVPEDPAKFIEWSERRAAERVGGLRWKRQGTVILHGSLLEQAVRDSVERAARQYEFECERHEQWLSQERARADVEAEIAAANAAAKERLAKYLQRGH